MLQSMSGDTVQTFLVQKGGEFREFLLLHATANKHAIPSEAPTLEAMKKEWAEHATESTEALANKLCLYFGIQSWVGFFSYEHTPTWSRIHAYIVLFVTALASV